MLVLRGLFDFAENNFCQSVVFHFIAPIKFAAARAQSLLSFHLY